MTDTIVITRHAAFVELLRERGLIDKDVLVVPDCRDPEQIRDRVVIGPCPLHLAALARCVIHFPIRMDRGDRGRELSLEELRERVGEPEEYRIYRDPLQALERLQLEIKLRAIAAENGLPRRIRPFELLLELLNHWAKLHGLKEARPGPHRRPGPYVVTEDARNGLAALVELPAAPFEEDRRAWVSTDGRPEIQILVEAFPGSGLGSVLRTFERRYHGG